MLPIFECSNRDNKRCIHIEITNACNLVCANCTRFVGHHHRPYFMSVDDVRKGILSLEGFGGNIGMMGGEPTLHPEFKEICKVFQELIPDKNRRQLWTDGFKWDVHEEVIHETFHKHNILYNDHKSPEGRHQPLLMAAKDLVEDEQYMWELIDKCWIQERWSCSITPKGGFFCEVAAAQDMLFDGPGGYPLEPGWWKKTPDDFQDQVKRYCQNCSAAIPMERPKASDSCDLITISNEEKLKENRSRRYKRGHTQTFCQKMSKEEIEHNKLNWRPWEHRSFKQSTPELTTHMALVEYAQKESTGREELEEMIKSGILSKKDLI